MSFDLTPDNTLLEAGLHHAVSLNKRCAFTSHKALIGSGLNRVLEKRLVNFKLDNAAPVLRGEELIHVDSINCRL